MSRLLLEHSCSVMLKHGQAGMPEHASMQCTYVTRRHELTNHPDYSTSEKTSPESDARAGECESGGGS
jgi:hypothetical protein